MKQEIDGQKNEISEREKTIRDKDNRILSLKKKTQELEKFKFVLDYKIKELKRDIGPREIEIQKLKEQTSKMEQELKHFNRVNQNLGLIVDDLRMRQEGLQNEVRKQKETLEKQENYKKMFKDDVYECMQFISDYKQLKANAIRLHKIYVKEEIKNDQGEADLQKEYASQRKYLEKSVDYLRRMISKDSDVHRQENNKIMKENVQLLQEINDLRKEVKELKKKERSQHMDSVMGSTMRSKYGESTARSHGQTPKAEKDPKVAEQLKELKLQDTIIEDLQRKLKAATDEGDVLRTRRPESKGPLPPLGEEPGAAAPGEGPEEHVDMKPSLAYPEKEEEDKARQEEEPLAQEEQPSPGREEEEEASPMKAAAAEEESPEKGAEEGPAEE